MLVVARAVGAGAVLLVKYAKKSMMRWVNPSEPLKKSIAAWEAPARTITKLGTVWLASKFRFDDNGAGGGAGQTVMYPGAVGIVTVTLKITAPISDAEGELLLNWRIACGGSH